MAPSEKFVCVIPARYDSSRFPGKPLAHISGQPMILRVAENAQKASHVFRVIVATDNDEIAEVVSGAGYEVVVTSDCPNGSARVAEVVKDLSEDFVFEMQGDQPLVTPDMIDDFLVRAKTQYEESSSIDVVHPFAPASDEQTQNRDVLKVIKTARDRLVFQTRHPIQSGFRTLGLYLWKRDALLRFSELPVSGIEKAEDSHPIRLYVNDFYVQGIKMDGTDWIEVDRESQIAEVERIMKEKGIV